MTLGSYFNCCLLNILVMLKCFMITHDARIILYMGCFCNLGLAHHRHPHHM